MLPTKIAFVDLETTGTYAQKDRIIEIGIVICENNEITKTYQTLVNPQSYVSPFITTMTGIREEELFEAPSFERIADEVFALLEDCVFVAHNARFDLGFLRQEFARFDLTFSPKHFCTVKLSRMLFPQEKRHNLDSIIERFGFSCERRHRAFDDARVLYDFYRKIQEVVPADQLLEKVNNALKKPSLPSTISSEVIAHLPQSPGVYIFYDARGVPLYVGKSTNIRSRVLSHFSSDHTSHKEMQIAQQIHHIETHKTAGELGALLKEATLVKTLQPTYNRLLRQNKVLTVLKRKTTPEGYSTASIEQVKQLDKSEVNTILGVFKSKKQAREYLLDIAKKHKLCNKLLGLEATNNSYCFSYHLEQCRGACMQKEPSVSYNLRAILAFSTRSFTKWPYAGAVLIRESDEEHAETFLVNNWCVLPQDGTQNEQFFDVDTYKILKRYFSDQKNWRNIHPVESKEQVTEEFEGHFQYV